MNIEIGNKPIDFVFQGDELIYPNYVAKDNLVLHYDFSGRTNLDVKKGIAEDLSGNGNDGILENFAYESGSGYDSNSYLEFDNVDDFITIPELNLDVNNFTVAVDGEVLSYRGDNVAKINENGLEIGGRNYLLGSNKLSTILDRMDGSTILVSEEEGGIYNVKTEGGFTSNKVTIRQPNNFQIGDNVTISFWVNNKTDTGIRVLLRGVSYNSKVIPANYAGFFWHSVEKSTDFDNLLYFSSINSETNLNFDISPIKLEKGTIPTDWSPAPEDLQTTKITPIFSNKIKTLMYWNMALTDTELQEVYNVQKYRI